MRQTFMANESNIERKWYVVDAEGQTLGRLSSEVAAILRGKILHLTDEQKAKGIITASAGNHAQGLALTGQLLGIDA
ncbi:uL13 family ribosomal protein, partial [Staphylococcus pseudintermedius]|uniref:uL13 family ribosomal protein n=1 Tax=Staphylococcus pseudintermedius TaxID=283734 RepID=UPI0036F19F7A